MNILGFIPARKGSKGIPGKNFKKLNGHPLIKYTLDTIKKLQKKSNVYIFISTDDEKIKRYCKRKGFEIIYNRPKNLSTSKSNIVDTVLHGLRWFENYNKINIDTILLLQPTSPIRKIDEISKAIDYFKKKKIQSLVSVSPVKEHPFQILEEKKDNRWRFIKKPKKKVIRRQEYKKDFYFVDGNFYIVKKNFLVNKKTFVKENHTKLFKLKRNWPVDIDNLEDFSVAATLLKNN